MINELDMSGMLNTGIEFDISDELISEIRPSNDLERIAKPLIDRIKQNNYGILYFGSFFESDSLKGYQKLSMEIFIYPKDILAYFLFEKELQDEGYKVRFDRDSKLI